MPELVVIIFVGLIFLLGWGWRRQLGVKRAALVALCRGLWLLPLLLALWPRASVVREAGDYVPRVLHVLVDDSVSMRDMAGITRGVVDKARWRCEALGCRVQVRYLSQLSAEVGRGYTPLSLVLGDWLAEVGDDVWLLVTDGGDWQPRLAWRSVLAEELGSGRGLVLGWQREQDKNVWIEAVDLVPLAFENSPADVQLVVRRTSAEAQERVQVQVVVDGKVLAGENIVFAETMDRVSLTLHVPVLPRGVHLLRVEVLPVAGEKVLWDNSRAVVLEVLPNTVGVLHLLGSPSWDGSFVRRYLKAEPRYDLISFFILRDPFDDTKVDERELSLIPFPVDQLFGEELKNLRVVIMQNFSLVRFLQPQHQQNLVDFVLRGGALLFIGGARSLRYEDIVTSPLGKILQVDKRTASLQRKYGSWDKDLAFRLRFAQPSADQRALASIYDDWLEMREELLGFGGGRGLNRLVLGGDAYTPLLTAVGKDGEELPLLVASYPGKGRALWLFSDSLWRLAMEGVSRYSYHKFLQLAMTWLLQRDLQRPLEISNFVLRRDRKLGVLWQLQLRGAATKYFAASEQWQLTLCGRVIDWSEVSVEVLGVQRKNLTGRIDTGAITQCRVEIAGLDKAFGALRAESVALVPVLAKDEEVGRAPAHAQALAELLGVPYVGVADKFNSALSAFMSAQFGEVEHAPQMQERVERNHFWVLGEPWYWLLLLFLPAEVLVRRWREIG